MIAINAQGYMERPDNRRSDDTIVIEGNHYFPPNSVNKNFLVPSNHHSVCYWKGEASYYDVVVDGEANKNAAWYYPSPDPESLGVAGEDYSNFVAFWYGVEVE